MVEPQVTIETAKNLATGIVVEKTSSSKSPLPADIEAALTRLEAGRAEESLKMLADEVFYTKEDVVGVLRENLSSESRDTRTDQKKEPKPGTPERARYEEALKTAEALRVYLESGGQNIPDELLPSIYDYLSKSPLFRDLILSENNGVLTLKSNEAQAIAKTLLQQPEVRKAILRLFTERLDPKKTLEHEARVRELQATLDALKGQVVLESESEIADKINAERARLVQTKADQASDPHFDDYTTKKILLSDIRRVIDGLEGNKLPLVFGRNNTLNPVVQDLLTRLGSQLQGQVDKGQVLAELYKYQSNLELTLQTDPNFKSIRKLEGEISVLESKIRSLEERRDRIDTEDNRRLIAQYRQTGQQLQEAQALLTAERIKYASEIIAIPAEAVKEFLDGALDKAAKYYKEEAAKSAQEKEVEKQKLEQEALRKIGEGLGTKKKKVKVNGITTEVTVPDKKSASELMALLMQPNGLVEFGKKIVADLYYINTSTSPPKYTFKTDNRYGLTQAEADLIINKLGSYDYLKTTGLPLAKAVMANYFLASGGLNQDMVYALLNSEVGQSLIDDGKKLAKEKIDALKGIFSDDVLKEFKEIKQGKGMEWLRDNWWKAGLGIAALLILLGLGLKR